MEWAGWLLCPAQLSSSIPSTFSLRMRKLIVNWLKREGSGPQENSPMNEMNCCSRGAQPAHPTTQLSLFAALPSADKEWSWMGCGAGMESINLSFFFFLFGGLWGGHRPMAPPKRESRKKKERKIDEMKAIKWEWNQMKLNFFSFVWWNVFGPTASEIKQLFFFSSISLRKASVRSQQRERKREWRAAEQLGWAPAPFKHSINFMFSFRQLTRRLGSHALSHPWKGGNPTLSLSLDWRERAKNISTVRELINLKRKEKVEWVWAGRKTYNPLRRN